MKTWLFALLESVIALLGLAGYFFADNMLLTGSAVVAGTAVGVFQSLSSARQKNRLDAYQQQQFQKGIDAVDEQLQALLDEVIAPPLPHRASVCVLLRTRFGEKAEALLDEYDRIVEALTSGAGVAELLAAALAEKIPDSSIGPYLHGLACLANGKIDAARTRFLTATQRQPGWIVPWLGWAAAAARLGRWDEIRENHPHLNSVELLPYDVGDEQTFLQLSEPERETLVDGFQHAARSLGNYYTIAELSRSKVQMLKSEAEYRKAA